MQYVVTLCMVKITASRWGIDVAFQNVPINTCHGNKYEQIRSQMMRGTCYTMPSLEMCIHGEETSLETYSSGIQTVGQFSCNESHKTKVRILMLGKCLFKNGRPPPSRYALSDTAYTIINICYVPFSLEESCNIEIIRISTLEECNSTDSKYIHLYWMLRALCIQLSKLKNKFAWPC